ncbi:156_t:CDS:1, partial [Paraglomus occultum]
SEKQDPLLKWLMRQELCDTYRTINPESKEFSWSSRDSSSRIDQIWITEDLSYGLYDAEIQEMDICTNSDHNVVLAKLDLKHLIATWSSADLKRLGQQRTIYLYDKATKEDWENYKAELDQQLKKKINIQDLKNVSYNLNNASVPTNTKNRLDNWWNIICNGIQSAARKSLPKKKILNTVANKKKQTKKTKLTKVLTQLGRWIRI